MSLNKVLRSLESGAFRKIICGAANTSEQQVERIALVYSLAGVDVLDTAPRENIHDAVRRGMDKALQINHKTTLPLIMTSVNIGDDKHFRKASFDLSRCVQCLECVKICDINNDPEKCYGCARCVEACQHNAVSMIKFPDEKITKPSDAIEIHTGNASVEELAAYLELNRGIIRETGLISVNISSERFNRPELVQYTSSVLKLFDKKIIIQIDGLSMRGGSGKTSTLQTVAAASTLLDAGVDAYIQLAGGTNYLTSEIVRLTGLKVSGIGYGTFAKKIILSYIEQYNEEDFIANIDKITDVAVNLIKRAL